MAHFAKLDKNNIVIFVTVGRDEDKEDELTARSSKKRKSKKKLCIIRNCKGL